MRTRLATAMMLAAATAATGTGHRNARAGGGDGAPVTLIREPGFVTLANGLVNIEITYLYNQTNTRHNYVYPFYLKEGTNLSG